ncbi:UDP-N-acetylmuramoyl-L-alanyl-D-glutamate--2,6-diaminopimelate ligase [bacterium]|nr:MAG: UDP-N-acetylmuramoyl-L-alanyl-D-glutamate--2,6-diaminopimelate ligase [bacterium]
MIQHPVPLHALLAGVDVVAADGDLDVAVGRITHDSRRVTPGTLFVAYAGVYEDVHRYLPDAVARGAAAALVERPPDALRAAWGIDAAVPLVQVADARRARALVAAALFGHPSRHLAVVGVTGTDGKTTTSTLIHAMLRAAGRRAGLVSTVAAHIGDEAVDTGLHVTTPEPEDLQAFLAAMHAHDTDVAVLEVTSHGLAQHRVTGVKFDVAVITNVTHESLEYHGTFEAYTEAKALLFHMLAETPPYPGVHKTAVLNAGDPSFARFRAIPVARQLTYSLTGPADFRARDLRHSAGGLAFTADTPVGPVDVRSRLVGHYNAANILAAMAAAHALGLDADAWRAGVAAVEGIPGRMQAIDGGQPFLALVDFAHTPNALRSALATARELVGPMGRVIAVFGCAGLRDPAKRGDMGRVAAAMADLTIVTAEDPRTEDPAAIVDQIARGLADAGGVEGETFWREVDRGTAIRRACATAEPADVVIVCGKGHEQSMCFGTIEYPWDDRDAVRAALAGEPYGALPTAG